MLELVEKQNPFNDGYVFYDILINNELAGSIELSRLDKDSLYIENIKKSNTYKGNHVLKQVIQYLHKTSNIICMPLKKYIPYYESLGFELLVKADNGEDNLYILRLK